MSVESLMQAVDLIHQCEAEYTKTGKGNAAAQLGTLADELSQIIHRTGEAQQGPTQRSRQDQIKNSPQAMAPQGPGQMMPQHH